MGMFIFGLIVGLVIGAIAGFFGARYFMKKYFMENPPISEEMLKTMMMQMGQKPSARKLNQIMSMMKAQQKKEMQKKK
ncbi:MAG: YneF family protein [Candidatus Paralactobacillus gallistercoris]|uniref:YneF family protein n=1 Tax=Candidatus Paralactobacillus gallistercoris TaxID=2838724 RepID=A0A948TK39_9LACO|nr:YneF family protein [Candidatus Paralactobacillus gallistercoris]